MKVLAISGSLREGSWNTQLLRQVAELADDVEVKFFTKLAAVPPYSEDDERERPEAVAALAADVASADAVLISTPEYNGSVPGVLKNALDWASRPYATGVFRGKPVAVIGASTGPFGAVWAQADLRRILGVMGARVHETELPVGQVDQTLGSEEVRDALKRLVVELQGKTPAAA